MSYRVYIIKSESTGKLYTGQTNNLELRLARHNCEIKGRNKCFTHKNCGPWVPIYKEEFSTRSEAIKREKELKSFRGRQYLKCVIGAIAQW